MTDSNNNNENLDSYHVIHETIPYVPLPTEILRNTRDPIVLAIWAYIRSWPPNTKFTVQQIAQHFTLDEKIVWEFFSTYHLGE